MVDKGSVIISSMRLETKWLLLAVSLFPGLALAQVIATSTEATLTQPVAESAFATTTPTADVTSEATTTETSTVTDTPAESHDQAKPSIPTIPTEVRSVVDDIATFEERRMRQGGRYLQVLKGNKLPSYEKGSVLEKLGRDVPTNVRVNIYEAPGGRGYQILYTAGDGTVYSVGYGPEAKDRTYITLPSVVTTLSVISSASSTSPTTMQATSSTPFLSDATTTQATSSLPVTVTTETTQESSSATKENATTTTTDVVPQSATTTKPETDNL